MIIAKIDEFNGTTIASYRTAQNAFDSVTSLVVSSYDAILLAWKATFPPLDEDIGVKKWTVP